MPDVIEQLRRRLVERGCPIKQMQRLVLEVADHRDDLKQAALTEGLSEADAEARADVLLGDPPVLAEQMMKMLRRSSWWGRHQVITFGLLPLLVYPILWALFLVLELLVVAGLGYGWDWNRLHLGADNPATFHRLFMTWQVVDFLAIALATSLFCWLARRAAVKSKWMRISCALCSLCAVIWWGRIQPHSLFLGFSLNSHLQMPWYRGAIPLVIAVTLYAFQRRRINRFRAQLAG